MKSKSKLIGIAIILTLAIFLLSGCQNRQNNESSNNTSNNSVSLRDQIANETQKQATTDTKLEDLEQYNKEEDSNYKTFTDTNGVSFMYPSNWISVGTEEEPAFMSIDGKGASVNIAVDSLDKGEGYVTEFDAYIGFQRLYLVQQMTMLTDIDQKIVNLNGKKAYILNYVTEQEQNGSKMQLNITQVAFEENGNVHILTLAVLNDYYKDFQSIFEKMTKSFMISE